MQETKKCPRCGKKKSLSDDFGMRTMADGSVRPQSWCIKCRKPDRAIVLPKAYIALRHLYKNEFGGRGNGTADFFRKELIATGKYKE